MSDRLEEFVKQHREQFDLQEPDPSIWLKINPATTPVVRERRPMRWLRVAATIALIFAGSSAGIYFLTGERGASGLYSNELYLEIQETEQYYTRMVAQRYNELEPFLAGNPAAREMLSTDMEELDEVYEELKEDLKDNVSNPEVIEAMILNYRVKLEILEDLLNQLKEKENQDYEKNGSYSL
jgi:predicted CopG family antitoxin